MKNKAFYVNAALLLLLAGVFSMLSSCSKDGEDDTYVAVEKISINKTYYEINRIGEHFQIVATIFPDNATNKKVRYKSFNEKVATVDENGLATVTGEGTTMILAEAEDGGASVIVGVKVELPRNRRSTWLTMYYDETMKFESSFIPSDWPIKVSNIDGQPKFSKLANIGDDVTISAIRPGILEFVLSGNNNDGYFTEFVTIKIFPRPLTEEKARQMLLDKTINKGCGINSKGEWWVKGDGFSIIGPTWKLVDADGDGDFSSAKIIGTEGTCNYSIYFGETKRTGTIYNCEEEFYYYNLTPSSVDYESLWNW